ncbi:MAG: hypothetical protein MZU84_05540 [Sphingobacterium sp.]|nr:hypothetical protein [Sphingobacterium sp.]
MEPATEPADAARRLFAADGLSTGISIGPRTACRIRGAVRAGSGDRAAIEAGFALPDRDSHAGRAAGARPWTGAGGGGALPGTGRSDARPQPAGAGGAVPDHGPGGRSARGQGAGFERQRCCRFRL